MDRETFERRLVILAAVIAGLFVVLALRLWQVQIVQGDYFLRLSEENGLRITSVAAPRGLIVDQQGRPLVANRPAFTVALAPSEVRDPAREVPLVASLLGLDSREVARKLAEARDQPFALIPLRRDVPKDTIAAVEESRMDLPGVVVEIEPVRQYLYGDLAAHLLGYLGEINDQELRALHDQGYQPGDLIGKDGVERVYDRYLRGRNGEIQAEVDAQGRPVRTLGTIPAVPGDTVVLGLNLDVQRAAEAALGNRRGAVVAMDPRTGAIVAMVSHPAFDPDLFSAGITAAAWNNLLRDPNQPLINRAIRGTYPPGSVFKIVTASAALELGDVHPDTQFYSPGYYKLGGWTFHEWKALGHVNFIDAIAQSCDACFYELSRRVGADNIAKYARRYGLGRLTGIDLPGESAGVVPDPAWKQRVFKQPWYGGDTLNTGIGQGYLLTTPLQIARMLAAVANNGALVTPHAVTEILTPQGQVVARIAPPPAGRVDVSPQTLAILHTGLAAVVSRGTASGVRIPGLPMAGKTGTAESVHGRPYAWFAAYAPVDAPRLVAVAMVEDAGFGSEFAAPIVQRVMEVAFGIGTPGATTRPAEVPAQAGDPGPAGESHP
jgi:penicillin-binding protein 2